MNDLFFPILKLTMLFIFTLNTSTKVSQFSYMRGEKFTRGLQINKK